MQRVCVLGLGNVLVGDDAAGPTLIHRLAARYEFPAGVTLFEAGTPGCDLLAHIMEIDALIVADTVRAAGQPGELRLYGRDEILAAPPPLRTGPHEPSLREALLAADFHGGGPRDVLLVGVIPELLEAGVGLTRAVQAALPAMERAVLAELERLGCAATRRSAPAPPEPWWRCSRAAADA